MDDIDPAREVPGAADDILRTLDALELHWDGAVLRQSKRFPEYRERVASLVAEGKAFHCSCTRRDLRSEPFIDDVGARYPGTCRSRRVRVGPTSVRARAEPGSLAVRDEFQGFHSVDVAKFVGDYVIYRKDGLPSYHLATVVDDDFQGITHVVRGADLLKSAAIQLHLYGLLHLTSEPAYAHVPMLVDRFGHKLSKRFGAMGVQPQSGMSVAARVLGILGCMPPIEIVAAPPGELWRWAIEQWDMSSLHGCSRITLEDH